MKIAVVKEISHGEQRVALIPDIVSRLVKQGLEIWVEAGAGEKSFWSNAAYTQAGAEIIADTDKLWGEADVVLKVAPPTLAEASKLRSGVTLISCLTPLATSN
jgi:H+-translocating NAD(P) transhydrogenase subunit alpha